MPLYEFAGKRPQLPADGSAWIAPSADLIGDVHLGADAGIWFGAMIRADNTPIVIGDRSNIQEGAVLHSDPGVPTTVGADCTVGHRAILHGCTLGDRVLIGMGAIILNNAVIPDDCLVGAGALVTEGKTFPSGSLIVGVPARAIRELSPQAIAGLKASADNYVAKKNAFGATLRRLD